MAASYEKTAQALASKYFQPVGFVMRGFQASASLKISPDAFVARYVKGDKSVEVDSRLAAEFKRFALAKRDSLGDKIANSQH